MTKTDKATAIIKLLKKGYSPKEVTQRMAVSYNYAWKLKKDLEKAAKDVKTTTLSVSSDFLESLSRGKGKPKPEPKSEPEVGAKAGEYIEFEGAESALEIDAILNSRGSNYGSFLGLSQVTQRLKGVAHQFAWQNNKTFDADQAEALDMIFTKLGRILNGDPNHVDSWVDIAGYAQLVADRLQGKVR